ncbi:hypothetical protein CHS0354_003472 [Potamilus streckersoni]|uniref:XPA C-terminal domain-containing protein n=1 Tax=Potamilus streckersoni TaxID=2493646 RepID=A0AAE0SP88_9BIVA|nr:hypothetical protein CHS0354_003472 [Potamilus streckersoni]
METVADTGKRLTAAQRAKIERNRQKALLLRQSRLIAHPYTSEAASGWKVNGPARQIDTGAGFFLEEEDEKEKCKQEIKHQPGPLMVIENLICEDCGKEFLESYFYDKFHYSVCDNCRQNEETHPLITKTDARNKYLLKNADLDKREPPLHFVIRKNPHNSKWGDMKLYLECQVAYNIKTSNYTFNLSSLKICVTKKCHSFSHVISTHCKNIAVYHKSIS